MIENKTPRNWGVFFFRHIARFIGVVRNAVNMVLNKLEDPDNSELPESLKPFAGKAYTRTIAGDSNGGQSQIIPGDVPTLNQRLQLGLPAHLS